MRAVPCGSNCKNDDGSAAETADPNLSALAWGISAQQCLAGGDYVIDAGTGHSRTMLCQEV